MFINPSKCYCKCLSWSTQIISYMFCYLLFVLSVINVIIFRFAKDRASDGMAHDCRSDLSNTAAVSIDWI